MTVIKFSESVALATTFAVKLVAGTLNVRTDYESTEHALVDVAHTTKWFSTDIMTDIRVAYVGDIVSRLEISDTEDNPESIGSEGRIRHVTVYVRDKRGRTETLVATFDLEQDFLDGDYATGWTAWRVTNVTLPNMYWHRTIQLVSDCIKDDDEPLWGRPIFD